LKLIFIGKICLSKIDMKDLSEQNNRAKKQIACKTFLEEDERFGNGDSFLTIRPDGKGPFLVTIFYNSDVKKMTNKQ